MSRAASSTARAIPPGAVWDAYDSAATVVLGAVLTAVAPAAVIVLRATGRLGRSAA